ncbi:SRCR domain-containing protein [Balamuthia mandrillaris]
MHPSLRLLQALCFLFVILAYGAPARAQISSLCETCVFSVGRAISSVDFSSAPGSSLVLPVNVSHALRDSETPRSFTVEMWVRTPQPHIAEEDPQLAIVARYPRTEPERSSRSSAEFWFGIDNGHLVLFMGRTRKKDGSLGLLRDCGFNKVTPNSWTHLALSIITADYADNPKEIRVWVNGERQACSWMDLVDEPFLGRRNVLHDDSFSFSGFRVAEDPNQAWNGHMDEIRIWAGGKEDEDIWNNYKLPLNPAEHPSLLAYYQFDEQFPDGLIAHDSTANGFDAAFGAGFEGDQPEYTGSDSLPLRHVVRAVAGIPTELTLYTWSKNQGDSFYGIALDPLNNDDVGALYLDAALTRVYRGAPNPILVAEGERFPKLYYINMAAGGDFSDQVRFTVVSRFEDSEQEAMAPNVATIEINAYFCEDDPECRRGCDHEPFSEKEFDECEVCDGDNECVGCDGVPFSGLEFDLCDVCNGTNECLSGCDNKPYSDKVFDDCGECGGDGLSCLCQLDEYRGNDLDDLDNIVTHYSLDNVRDILAETDALLTNIGDLLLADAAYHAGFDCQDYGVALEQISQFHEKTLLYVSYLQEYFQPSFE